MGFDSPLGYNMKQIRFQIGIVILLAAGLLAGCAHDNEPTMLSEIAVSTGVTGMQKRVQSIDGAAALQAQDIKIDAYYSGTDTKYLNSVKLKYSSSAWRFWEGNPGSEVHYYWPFEGSKTESGVTASTLDFVGACPFTAPNYILGTAYAHASGTTFNCYLGDYMTSSEQESMQEYVIAVLNAQTYAIQAASPGGALPMSFKHPFALVKFVIAPASGEHVTIDSIGIAGLSTTGTCTYDGSDITWSGQSGSAAMKIIPATPLAANDETVQMMVIPNTYAPTTLAVRGTWDDWSDVENQTVSAEVNFAWQPGYIYTYNLTVSKYALKVDIAKYTEQW